MIQAINDLFTIADPDHWWHNVLSCVRGMGAIFNNRGAVETSLRSPRPSRWAWTKCQAWSTGAMPKSKLRQH